MQPQSDSDKLAAQLMELCPTGMRELLAPMVQLAVAQMPADSVSSLSRDLKNARDENGEPDIAKLIEVGKQFGLTDDMVAGYQSGLEALTSAPY